MSELEVGGHVLGKIHRANNDKKYFCYFTGFLEGIVASGAIETGEIEPLIAQCEDFVRNVNDCDANEIIEDFNADLLEHVSLTDAIEYRNREIDEQCKKSAVNRFLGFCAGISCDNIISELEAKALIVRGVSRPEILADPVARNLVYLCEEALDDGIIEPQESSEICEAITRLVGDAYCDTGISELGNMPVVEIHRLNGDLAYFDGATVVLTGAFSVRPRRKIEEKLVELGCQISKSVSKKTNIVVIASEASRDWVHTHKGTKMIKALSLREEYGSPQFVQEADLLTALDLS